LTNKTGLKFAEVIRDSGLKLREAGFKWNKFTSVAGLEIAKSLAENKHLKILDLSWNRLGEKPPDIPNKK